ncbi:MAG: HEAT repeat domain-containing protein [Phycisphaerae bacterium]|nr:HEAT repeat domain-containing protein [Phycisphaerae bacterium]
MMKIRKRWIILAAVLVLAAAIGGWYWHHTTTDEYKAQQLVNELCQWHAIKTDPGTLKGWLIKLGVMKESEPRNWDEIWEDLSSLGEAAVPPLTQALKNKDVYIRICAADALLMIRLPCVPSDEGIEDVRPAQDPDFRREAADALIKALKDDDYGVRAHSAWALGKMSPPTDEVILVLREAQKDKHADVRRAAAEALKQIEGSSSQ